MDVFFRMFGQILGQAPTLIVYVAGLFIASENWNKSRKRAQLVLISMAIMLIFSLGVGALNFVILQERETLGIAAERLGFIFGAVGLVSSLAHATAIGLLLKAVFTSELSQG